VSASRTLSLCVALWATLSPTPLLAADLVTLRKGLVDAVEGKDPKRVRAAAQSLAEEGSATAAEILIVDGLLSGDPRAESAVREVLEGLPPGPAFDWICESANRHARAAVRDQLVRVLAPRTERSAITAVLTALFDESDGVKTSAIIGLEAKNERAVIPHLIRALQREEERELELGQIANELRRVLDLWTGQELFGSGEYEELWAHHEKELLDPANRKKKDPLAGVELVRRGTSVEVKYPALFGQELLTQQVVFVLDTSISMKEEDPVAAGAEGADAPRGSRQRLKRVQNEFVRLISDMPARFRFSIISYDEAVVPFSKGLQPASAGNKRQAVTFIRGFEANGETWTDRALEAAFEIPGVRTIVLLSDGMPCRDEKPIPAPAILDWVDDRNRFEHITIHTIGFRSSSGEVSGFLRELARRNRGDYRELD